MGCSILGGAESLKFWNICVRKYTNSQKEYQYETDVRNIQLHSIHYFIYFLVYLTKFLVDQTTQRRMIGLLINNEL
jgi:hypothetical protein